MKIGQAICEWCGYKTTTGGIIDHYKVCKKKPEMLTENEIKAIEKEAGQYSASQHVMGERATYGYKAYIAAATQERIKAKKLLEALEEIKKFNGAGFYQLPILRIKDIAMEAINEYNKP